MTDFTEKCRKAIEYIETLSPDMTERTGLTYFVKEHFSLQHRMCFADNFAADKRAEREKQFLTELRSVLAEPEDNASKGS
jgi:hypothetical protein